MQEIRPGHKQTEVGGIPEDWQAFSISDLGGASRPPVKAGPFGSAIKKENYVKSGFKVYGQEQVIRGDHRFGDYYIDRRKFLDLESCSVRPGDILLSLVGTAGKVLLVPEDAEPGVINPRLLRISLDDNLVYSIYLKYVFESEAFQNRLERSAQGGTMGVLNAGAIRPIQILLPCVTEQRAIAAALADADALIAVLERMIAKKRDLKQAAMQHLLTGKTRLPGFSGEWEVKRLGEVLSVRHGKSQKEVETTGGRYPIFATGGEIGRSDVFLYDKPSVLIGRKGTIDEPRYANTPFWTIDTLFYTEISARAVPLFIYYKFLTIDWRSYNEASGVPSLSSKTIEKIEIGCPEPAEQTAIAEVLSDMDADLAALEARVAKARAVKQGMMQELLTGRVRLV